MDIEFDKASQRLRYRQMRDAFVAELSSQDRARAFSRIPTALKAMLAPGKTLAGYVAKDSEADPSALLAEAHGMGCNIALPHITSRAAPMRFLRWVPGARLDAGPFGLRQPPIDAPVCTPDVALVPLIAYDDRLMRLGQGAGHYDRALSLLDSTFAIGLAWSIQHAPSLIVDPWDVPLHAVLTEKAWITS
jgi:5-formyltetrahydrofolate cyclo-ligase